jgi:hypothetical protein
VQRGASLRKSTLLGGDNSLSALRGCCSILYRDAGFQSERRCIS